MGNEQVKLPPLLEMRHLEGFHDYAKRFARAAVLADREHRASQPAQQAAEAVAWDGFVRLDRHPLIRQSYEVSHAIENCGASPALTHAVTLSSALTSAIAKAVGEAMLASAPSVTPDAGAVEANRIDAERYRIIRDVGATFAIDEKDYHVCEWAMDDALDAAIGCAGEKKA